ncbi:MAG: sensor histidine kinase KdpD [Chloroflexi bacterium]|nr:sensor histidine kinase KdpD [Chloroflexota bacterium]
MEQLAEQRAEGAGGGQMMGILQGERLKTLLERAWGSSSGAPLPPREDDAAWPGRERLLVAVSASPLSARLIRAAQRMAEGLNAEWMAVCVETPQYARLSESARARLTQNLNLAEQLGGKTVILSAANASGEILAYARAQQVSKIIVGKPIHPRWRDLFFGSFVDELVRHSGDIDIYIIHGEGETSFVPAARALQSPWQDYALAAALIGLCTLLAALMHTRFLPGSISMVYLLGIVLAAALYGRGPALLAALLAVALFDYFFVPPYRSFNVTNSEYALTSLVMVIVGWTVNTLARRIRYQVEAARQRERRTAALYDMTRELAATQSSATLARIAARHIGALFEAQVALLLPDDNGSLCAAHQPVPPIENDVAAYVYAQGRPAGQHTAARQAARLTYLPLRTAAGATVGVLGVLPAQPQRFASPEQMHLLETFTAQITLALERAHLAAEAESTRVQIESERLRSTLLSSISHDLRTPLASMTGAASTLLQEQIDAAARRELATIVYEEANRLNRLVANLLDMTRLESGVRLHKEWYPLEEIVGATINRLEPQLQNRPLTTALADDLPPVRVDSLLIEQVLVNLLENAAKYTPAGTPIRLSAWAAEEVTVEVADQGPGLPPGTEEKIFDKFFRALPTAAGGIGLGLTICRAIIEAHGGRIWALNRAEGGAAFRFTLPYEPPPEIQVEDV